MNAPSTRFGQPAAGPARPLRLAQVIDTLQRGGTQKMQLVLAQALGEAAVITVFVLRAAMDPGLRAGLERLGARVEAVKARGLADPLTLARLTANLRRGNFDLVQTHLTYANVLGVWAARLAGRPVIASLRSAGFDLPARKRGVARFEAWTLRLAATHILANGRSVADFHRPRFGGRAIEVIPNAVFANAGLPAAERRALREQLAGNGARPLLAAVGRLTEAKGYPDLLAAMARVISQHPSALLLVAGEGPQRAALEAQAAASGLEGHVRLLGQRDDVPRLLAASDVFISASHWEGFPNVILEAMAAGLPVVATAVGETPYIVPAEAGLVTPPHDPAALAQALSHLLGDAARREAMGRAGQTLAERDYGPAALGQRMLGMYQSVRLGASRRMERGA